MDNNGVTSDGIQILVAIAQFDKMIGILGEVHKSFTL